MVSRRRAREVSAAKAKGRPLTVTDLPTGWSAEPDDSSSTRDSSDDYAQRPKYADVTTKTAAMDGISAGFTSPSGSDVVEGILPLTESAARELLTEFSDAVTALQGR